VLPYVTEVACDTTPERPVRADQHVNRSAPRRRCVRSRESRSQNWAGAEEGGRNARVAPGHDIREGGAAPDLQWVEHTASTRIPVLRARHMLPPATPRACLPLRGDRG
jgi:hypothetical protein